MTISTSSTFLVKVTQSCLTLCDSLDCQASLFMEFSRQECWSGLPFPPSGDPPNPGMEPRSPTLQVDSLPSEPPGKPTVPQHVLITPEAHLHPLTVTCPCPSSPCTLYCVSGSARFRHLTSMELMLKAWPPGTGAKLNLRDSLGQSRKEELYCFARQRGPQQAHAPRNCVPQPGVSWQWLKGRGC